MITRKILFLVHDPGGYDVVFPVFQLYTMLGYPVNLWCIGPSASLNAEYAIPVSDVPNLIDKEISEGNISGLVTGTSWASSAELIAISLCRASGISTFTILDYWSNYSIRFKLESNYIFPDYFIVMDEVAEMGAIQDGIPSEIIFKLGHPGLDHIISLRNQLKTGSVDRKSLSDDKIKLLFLSQPLSLLYGNLFGFTEEKVLLDLIELTNDYHLDVKFHPKDDELFRKKYENYEVKGILLELLNEYDIVIGMNTIGLLHGVLMNKACVSYQPDLHREDECITNILGLTTLVTSLEDLRENLKNIGNTVDMLDDLREQYMWLDGKSTNRVFHFIEEVLNGQD